MSIRGFGSQTLTGTAQPLLGTTLTAGLLITPDQYTGTLDPRSNQSITTATVASSSNFTKGDRVLVGVAAGPFDQGEVVGVIDATHIQITKLSKPHATGELVILSIQSQAISLLSGTGTLYIGGDSTVSSTSKTLAWSLLTGQSYDWGRSGAGNLLGTGSIWVQGTAADSYLVMLVTV